ncbi:nucleic acid/nucleotide deaminase domain-containing protein [Streptomyces sp. KL116D]|uniref:WXG100-like domain-containing protein n=1 Tax=Streptomyces sp. KL116D TaxID=3045152 RepID=UPI0035580B11
MGYTIPGWLDEVLEFIGINFPNVDEDDYRDMADAMREFAEKFEGHGGDAHKAFARLLSSSEGWAVDSMEKHWNKVKASHLEKLPELARLFADACDTLAVIVEAMKRKAEIELAVMAGSVGISAGLAVVTGGLSALIGAAEVAAMRKIVKRIIDEAVDRIVEEVIAKVTEPVNAKLEAMVEDMVLDLAEGAFSMPAGDGGSSGGHGKGGMQIASAGGPGGGEGPPQKRTKIDHIEFEDGAGKVSGHGKELLAGAGDPLGRARGAFGRSKGRDPFTQAFDSVLHGALKGTDKALGKVAKHITETVPDRVKATSRLHKGKDHDVRDAADKVETKKSGPTPMYLLDHDGNVQRLMPDGTTRPLAPDDKSGIHSVLDDGKAWHPWHSGGDPFGVKNGGEKADRVESDKIAPGSNELARATQIARYYNAHERPELYKRGGANYAAALFDDNDQRKFILIGTSGPVHSERVIGYPVLKHGEEGNLTHLYTEREPCQEQNMYCDQWLDQRFEGAGVEHSAKYDQDEAGSDGKELSKYKQDREHRAYVSWLHDQWKEHGVAGGVTDTMMDLGPKDRHFRP